MDDQRADREGGGTLEPKSSVMSVIADLLIANGAMLLVVSLPFGMSFGATVFWGDWQWTAICTTVLTLTIAALGGGMLATGMYLSRRQMHGK
jgi:hypothetical protein